MKIYHKSARVPLTCRDEKWIRNVTEKEEKYIEM